MTLVQTGNLNSKLTQTNKTLHIRLKKSSLATIHIQKPYVSFNTHRPKNTSNREHFIHGELLSLKFE